eukprot:2802147-Amphidinium_carterae.3
MSAAVLATSQELLYDTIPHHVHQHRLQHPRHATPFPLVHEYQRMAGIVGGGLEPAHIHMTDELRERADRSSDGEGRSHSTYMVAREVEDREGGDDVPRRVMRTMWGDNKDRGSE